MNKWKAAEENKNLYLPLFIPRMIIKYPKINWNTIKKMITNKITSRFYL